MRKPNNKTLTNEETLREVMNFCHDMQMSKDSILDLQKNMLGTYKICFEAAKDGVLKEPKKVLENLLKMLEYSNGIISCGNRIGILNKDVFDQIMEKFKKQYEEKGGKKDA